MMDATRSGREFEAAMICGLTNTQPATPVKVEDVQSQNLATADRYTESEGNSQRDVPTTSAYLHKRKRTLRDQTDGHDIGRQG